MRLSKVKKRLEGQNGDMRKGSADLEYTSELSRSFGGFTVASAPAAAVAAPPPSARSPNCPMQRAAAVADKPHSAGGSSCGSSPSSTLMVPLPEHPENRSTGSSPASSPRTSPLPFWRRRPQRSSRLEKQANLGVSASEDDDSGGGGGIMGRLRD